MSNITIRWQETCCQLNPHQEAIKGCTIRRLRDSKAYKNSHLPISSLHPLPSQKIDKSNTYVINLCRNRHYQFNFCDHPMLSVMLIENRSLKLLTDPLILLGNQKLNSCFLQSYVYKYSIKNCSL